jgi:hypothetical protein
LDFRLPILDQFLGSAKSLRLLPIQNPKSKIQNKFIPGVACVSGFHKSPGQRLSDE